MDIRGGYRGSRTRDITKGGGQCIRRAPLVHAMWYDTTFLGGGGGVILYIVLVIERSREIPFDPGP